MAIRFPARTRALIAILTATTAGLLLAPGFASATPATPPTTVASVTAQLNQLAQQNEVLTEQLNLVIAEIAADKQAAGTAQASAQRATAVYAAERKLLAQSLSAQYEGGSSFSGTGALLNSRSGQDYIDKMSTLNLISVHRGDIMTQVKAAKTAADQAQAKVNSLLTQANAKQAALTAQQQTLNADQQKFRTQLATLSVAERTTYQSFGEPAVPVDTTALMLHTGSAAVQAAVNFALAQVGKPYVSDAAGPGSYDCSGLTMASWRAGGVSLPHNAAAQYGYGTHVAEADLQPGDLIFMYHPISHVTIYIGNGLMVSAPETGEDVKVVTVASEQDIYTGATRLVPSS